MGFLADFFGMDMALEDVLGTESTAVVSQRTGRREFPYDWSDFIGQNKAVELLLQTVGNDEVHPLLYGLPGLGKTTLIEIWAFHYHYNLLAIEGGSIVNAKELTAMLTQIKESTVFFIDEIHALPIRAAEKLYAPVQDKILNLGTLGAQELPSFVNFAGATTLLGSVPDPLRDRMLPIKLERYTDDEMVEFINMYRPELEGDALSLVVKNSRGVPRLAKRVLKIVSNNTVKEICNVLRMLKIVSGTTASERSVLQFLNKQSGRVGLTTIAHSVQIPTKDLVNIIEPTLLEDELMVIGTGGRELTNKGREYWEALRGEAMELVGEAT